MEDNDTRKQLDTTIILAVVKIAGTQYHVGGTVLDQFKAGDPISLHREPTNPYDNKAVEVLWESGNQEPPPAPPLPSPYAPPLKVGYIPKPLAQAIFALIEAGYNLQAQVTNDSDRSITISMSP